MAQQDNRCVRASRQVRACTCVLAGGRQCPNRLLHVAPKGRKADTRPLSRTAAALKRMHLSDAKQRGASVGLDALGRWLCAARGCDSHTWTHSVPAKAALAPGKEFPLVPRYESTPLGISGKAKIKWKNKQHCPDVKKKLSGRVQSSTRPVLWKDPTINPPTTSWRLSRHLQPDHRLFSMGLLSSSKPPNEG